MNPGCPHSRETMHGCARCHLSWPDRGLAVDRADERERRGYGGASAARRSACVAPRSG